MSALVHRGDTTTKQAKKIPLPNYMRKLHDVYRIGAIPRDVGLHMLDVAQDLWGGIFQQRQYNGEPALTVKWTQPAATQH